MVLSGIRKYGKQVCLIYAGEWYVSNKDEIIATLLGSCVSVCLFDAKNKIAGMNHFMLPGKITSVDAMLKATSAKYGVTAINELLGSMYALGAKKENITARLFGGGQVIDIESKKTAIPENNIRLARVMLEIQDIPILDDDTGGKFVRKVMFEVHSGKVFLKKSIKSGFNYDEIREFTKDKSGVIL